jgi:FixJ family two-component response regulator
MESVKQTAVDWLIEQLKKPYSDKYIMDIIDQAKEKHKQEIINAYRDGRSDQQSEKPSRFYNRWAELYYRETYGGNK